MNVAIDVAIIKELHVCYDYCATWDGATSQ
jgi:hypothetical protein